MNERGRKTHESNAVRSRRTKPLIRRRSFIAGAALAVATAAAGAGWIFFRRRRRRRRVSSRPAPAPKPGLGINLSGAHDWNTEFPFIDAFRLAREWISQREGAEWGQGPPLDLDADGWIRKLGPGAHADALIGSGGHLPVGEWTVLYDGDGTLEPWGPSGIEPLSSAPGRATFRVAPSNSGVFVRVRTTNPANPLRNVRVLQPGIAALPANPWNPTFLKRWEGVAAIRFMEWMRTNHSKIRTWNDRPLPSHATFAARGVPVELMVDLANRMRTPAWFCMPHLADDDYVRHFAGYVEQHLDPELKAYVEYSNEVWNGMFDQYRYAVEQGKQRSLSRDDDVAAARFYAQRSVEIFEIWRRSFKDPGRVVRVLASQVNDYLTPEILDWQDAADKADVLAIAPYLHFVLTPDSTPSSAAVSGWSSDELFAHLEADALPKMKLGVRLHKELAATSGLGLVAYEGGQHLVGAGGAENDENLSRLLIDANRDPRMGKLYREQYSAWTEYGGDLFCHFSSVVMPGKWGSWGLLEYHDADVRSSPKMLETLRWAQSRGQPVHVP